MKGCLKLPSPSPTPGVEESTPFYSNNNSSTTSTASSSSESHTTQIQRKTVAFGAEGSEEVYTADEWDRTPTEPAKKLSYQDLLELREIQRSLPRADQPYDLISSRSRYYLSAVPIALLPLLSEDNVNTADVDDDVDEVCSSRSSSQTSSGAASPAIGSPRSGSPTRWQSSSNSSSTSTTSSSTTSSTSPAQAPSSPLAHYTWTDTDVDDNDSTSTSTTSAWSINFKRQSPTPTRPPPSTAPSRSSPSPRASPLHKPFSHPHYMSSQTPGTSVYRPPAHLAHLVSTRVAPQRQKPSFSFLPLLDTPQPSSPASGPVGTGVEETTATTATADADADKTLLPSSPDSALFMAALNLNGIEFSSSTSSSEDAIHTDTEGDLTSDTDISSTYDPPTPSLTHASLDSSPPTSRASSCEPEFEVPGTEFFRLPPTPPATVDYKHGGLGQGQDSYFAPHEGQNHPHAPTHGYMREHGHGHGHIFHNLPPLRSHIRGSAAGGGFGFGFGTTPGKLEAVSSPSLVPPSPLMLDEAMEVRRMVEMKKDKPRKKRNFIVVNDVEIELDGSDDEDEAEGEEEEEDEVEKESTTNAAADVAASSIASTTPTAEDTALSETKFTCPMMPPSRSIDATKSSFSTPPLQPTNSNTLTTSSPLSSSAEASTTPTCFPPQSASLADAAADSGSSASGSTTTTVYMDPPAPADMDLHIPVRFKRAQV